MNPTHLLFLAEAAPAPSPGGGLGGVLIPMILIFVMFYFVLIRPQRKQQKAQDEMRKTIRVTDKVVSIGGIHGMVTGMTDRTVSVKIADGLSIKFDRTAIATVDSKGKGDDSSDEKEEENEEKEG